MWVLLVQVKTIKSWKIQGAVFSYCRERRWDFGEAEAREVVLFEVVIEGELSKGISQVLLKILVVGEL